MSPPALPTGGGAPLPRQTEAGAPGDGGTDPPVEQTEPPGVRGFRTWGGIYWFVFACFALVVVLLTIFSRLFA